MSYHKKPCISPRNLPLKENNKFDDIKQLWQKCIEVGKNMVYLKGGKLG
jgi:hypothetical protein